jgi:hypothetical protein
MARLNPGCELLSPVTVHNSYMPEGMWITDAKREPVETSRTDQEFTWRVPRRHSSACSHPSATAWMSSKTASNKEKKGSLRACVYSSKETSFRDERHPVHAVASHLRGQHQRRRECRISGTACRAALLHATNDPSSRRR